MGKAAQVPVTPSVLEWAMEESGYAPAEVATKVGVSADTLNEWLRGDSQPGMTQFRRLATLLRRTPSTLLLPEPPSRPTPKVEFRRSPSATRTALTPRERLYIREASRIQSLVSWLEGEMREQVEPLPRFTNLEPETAAAHICAMLPHPSDDDSVQTPAQAFRWWRSSLERLGVLVFGFPLGRGAVHGFSLSSDTAPVVAVNTWCRSEARSFTVFHELGHLLTGTASACLEAGPRFARPTDNIERWCERFAASVLLPREAVESFISRQLRRPLNLRVTTLDVPTRIATRFRVSLRAATLRLIEMNLAEWSLYEEIQPASETKPKGGGGGGMERGELRASQYGDRTVGLFLRALGQDVLGRTDVLDALNISDSDLSKLVGRRRRTA